MVRESEHQRKIMQWSRQSAVLKRYPELSLLYHIPNGGRRDPIEARHLKEQGVKPGVPDLHLPVARKGYHGLYIELKTEKGRATNKQKQWLSELVKQGYYAVVCHGWQDAQAVLMWYLNETM